jgi:hypothetical protein
MEQLKLLSKIELSVLSTDALITRIDMHRSMRDKMLGTSDPECSLKELSFREELQIISILTNRLQWVL